MEDPFPGQTPLPQNGSSYAGALLYDMTSFATSTSNGSGLSNNAVFQNLNAGIIAENSNIEVHNCLFKNIQPDKLPERTGTGQRHL